MVLHFQVQGRVQGVGFRWFVQREAAESACAAGCAIPKRARSRWSPRNAEELAELRASLRRGPRGSRVNRSSRTISPTAEAEELGPFRIDGAW